MESKNLYKCKVEQNIENFYIRRSRNISRSPFVKMRNIQKARPQVVPDLEGEIWRDIAGC
jgi:hypothetical protein